MVEAESYWRSRMCWYPELLEVSIVVVAGDSGDFEHLLVARVEVSNVVVTRAPRRLERGGCRSY
jgi:hypothetical protein